jgi:hypothetical protein
MPLPLQNPEVVFHNRCGAYLAPVLDIPDGGRVASLMEKAMEEIYDTRLLVRKRFHPSLLEHLF